MNARGINFVNSETTSMALLRRNQALHVRLFMTSTTTKSTMLIRLITKAFLNLHKILKRLLRSIRM